MSKRTVWAGGEFPTSPNGVTLALAIHHLELCCPKGTKRALKYLKPRSWGADRVAGPAVEALLKDIVNCSTTLPIAADYYRALVAVETIGGIDTIAGAMTKALRTIVLQGVDDLLMDGWANVANGMVRLAAFLRELDMCHPGGIGTAANRLGTFVVGVLDSVAFLQYTDRVVVPFLAKQLAKAAAEPEKLTEAMYLRLIRAFDTLIKSAATGVQRWAKEHVRTLFSRPLTLANEITS